MSKTIDSLVQASLDSNNFTGVILAQLHFPLAGSPVSPIQRYSNAYQSIFWDEDGLGEEEYLGLGNMVSMSVLTETTELAAQTIQLTLSGIPNEMVTGVFSDDYINEPVYLWYATLNPSTYAVEGGQSGPVLLFAGRMDFGTIEFGETATITINVTSRLADWERPRGGRFNNVYQVRHVDATDTGFRYVLGIQDRPIVWGGVNVQDRDGRGGGGDGDVRGQPPTQPN